MAPTIQQIREGLAAKLAPIKGVQVQPYLLAAPTPPTIWVFPGGPGDNAVEYDQTMGRGGDELMFTVQAFIGSPLDIGAQKRLDELLAPTGPSSVKAMLETLEGGELTVTLGGVIEDLRVTSATGYRHAELPGSSSRVLECSWFVQIYASGK